MTLSRLSATIAVAALWLVLSGCCLASVALATAPATDVMFVFDTSGSMEPVLEEAKQEIQDVIARLQDTVPNPEFGVSEVRDYGGSLYDEEQSDVPWRLDTPITGDSAAVFSAIEGLYADGGGDAPEAYGRALWESDTNPSVKWRPGARHLIVLIADNVPHAVNLDEGIAEEFWLSPSPWYTGEELPGSWGIPGTQLGGGHLEFHEVLRRIAADGKPLETVDYHDTGENYIHYWEAWAALGGGQALEAIEGPGELVGKLVGIVEHAPEDTVCATAFSTTPPSPPPGVAPSALTPRFKAPGSRLVLTPAAGKEFCQEQYPDLGGDVVTELEEDSASQIAFRVPGAAASGISITNFDGGESGLTGFGIDNFRYPWGLSVQNAAGNGDESYDAHITPTEQDLDSTFAGLGPSSSPEYKEALAEAKSLLGEGLCYGYALLSWGMYSDAHGGHVPLGYASSTGLKVSSTLPYLLHEYSTGTHALTHALMRAATSQISPTAQQALTKIYSSADLLSKLNDAFSSSRPALVNIHYVYDGKREGHSLLAYNYQTPDPATGEGVAIEVVDPNIPWSSGRPSSDFQMLQIHVRGDGSWSYDGTFGSVPFASPVSGVPGSLEVMAHPVDPGGLSLHETIAGEPSPVAVTATSGVIAGIDYGTAPSSTIPSDVTPESIATDGPENKLLVPVDHRRITVTLRGHRIGLRIAGSRFIDLVSIHGTQRTVSIDPHTGSISLQMAPNDTTVSATNVSSGGVQRTISATTKGKLSGLDVSVGDSGTVAVGSTRGSGSISLDAATYTAEGTQVHTRRETRRVHGHVRLRGHTPKPKHRKHRSKHKHRRKG